MFARSEEIGEMAKALCVMQGQLENAVKDSTNPHFKSKYADLSACFAACRKPLSDNKLSIIQMPFTEGSMVTITTMLIHESGQWMSNDLTMTSRQDTPQAIGSTITYARRYSLCSILGIASDDDDGQASMNKKNQAPPPPQKTSAQLRQETLEKMVFAFSKFGVSREQVEDKIGKGKSLDTFTHEDFANARLLIGKLTSGKTWDELTDTKPAEKE